MSCAGWPISHEPARGFRLHPLYDNYGNQTSVTDPNDNVTQFIHDHLNRLIGHAIPLGMETVSDATDYVESMTYIWIN